MNENSLEYYENDKFYKKNQEKKTNSIVNWPSLIFKIIMKNIR